MTGPMSLVRMNAYRVQLQLDAALEHWRSMQTPDDAVLEEYLQWTRHTDREPSREAMAEFLDWRTEDPDHAAERTR